MARFPILAVMLRPFAGADPGFQVRGGAHLKKIAPSVGRRENFWGISCEKSRFYAKKSYFSNFRGARAWCAAPVLAIKGDNHRIETVLERVS